MNSKNFDVIYNQRGYGTISSVQNSSFTIDKLEWAPGIWGYGENMNIEIRSINGLIRGSCIVKSVDMNNRIITGDVIPDNVIPTDVIWEKR